MAAHRDPLSGKRLDSWKEIAAFFGRAERTVKRWETERGLPVHRVPGSGRGSVFAYSDELAEWLKGKSEEIEADDSASGELALTPEVEGATPAATLGMPHARHETSGRVSPSMRDVGSPAPKPALTRARLAAWLLPLVLAAGLVLYLSIGRSSARFKALASRHAPNQQSQELYLKGRYYWNRRTPDDLNKAVDYFMQAIVQDPSDAQAYVGLADCYNLLREFGAMPSGDAYPRALAAAQRAVELDDSSADAHNSLAFATFWWTWHAATAEREFQRALALQPDFVLAHHWYATFLLALGRHAEALDQIEQAQRLEPSSAAILADKGLILWHGGRKNDALTLLKQLETSEPSLSSAHDYLGYVYREKQDYANALLEWRRSAELRHDQAGLAIADAREKGFAAGGVLGMQQGEFPVRKQWFDRGYGSAYQMAELSAALGKQKEAEDYLQMSFDRREAGLLVADPTVPALQSDPLYRQLRDQVRASLAQ